MNTQNAQQQGQREITPVDSVNVLWEHTRKLTGIDGNAHDELRMHKDWAIKVLENQYGVIQNQTKIIAELEAAAASVKEAVLDAVEPVEKEIAGKVVGSIEPVEPKDGYEPGSGPI